MPASPYGEPQFPARMSWAESEEQAQVLRDLATTDEFTSLGDVIRTLIKEALDMREDIRRANEEYAATEEGGEVCEVVSTPAGTALVRGPRSLAAPVELARIGDQLARQRPVGAVGEVPAISRAQLMAQERGEDSGQPDGS